MPSSSIPINTCMARQLLGFPVQGVAPWRWEGLRAIWDARTASYTQDCDLGTLMTKVQGGDAHIGNDEAGRHHGSAHDAPQRKGQGQQPQHEAAGGVPGV